MTTATHTPAPPRTGPAIRAVLVEWAPDELPRFEDEFHRALGEAAHTLDLSPIDELLERWRRRAAVRANPLTAAEEEQLRQARGGDDTGLWEQTEDDTFHCIG